MRNAGYAEQRIWFEAQADAGLQFDIDYAITHLLSSQVHETTFADATVGVSLYREGGVLDSTADDTLVDASTFYFWNAASDGTSWSEYTDGTFSLWGLFTSYEMGYVQLNLDGQATAAVAPVPGALLLGMLGMGTAGVLGRRFC